jgi:large subunit ribosomal protein L21
MFAVIKTGGKQYRVKEGDILSVEKLEAQQGQLVNFGQVLLVEDGESIQVGTPYLEKAAVKAEVLETYKDEHVIVFKKKRRKGYKRTKGHRQLLTKVRIVGIHAGGKVKEVAKPVKEVAPKKTRKKATAEREEKPAPKKTTRTRSPKKSEQSPPKKPGKEE